MKVKNAVRISVSIPLYFTAVLIDSAGHVQRRKNFTDKMDIMVDGGLSGNFPLFVFDSLTTVKGQVIRIVNQETIGLRIDTPEQIAYDRKAQGLAPIRISRFRNYVGAFYNYVIENLNRTGLTEEDWKRTVSISSGSIGPKVRKLSEGEKTMLFNNGRVAMQHFLVHSN
jgi:NTE family protein